MRHIVDDTQAIIVDYQEKLVPVMNDAQTLEKNSCILIKGLKALGVPMTITQQYTKGIGMTIPSFLKQRKLKNTWIRLYSAAMVRKI